MTERKILFIIFLLVFSLSVFHSFYFRVDTSVDAKFYDESGWDLAQGNGYSIGSIGRPGPGYEFFLGGIYYIFGHSHQAVWIIQAILLVLVAFVAFLFTKLIFGNLYKPVMGFWAAGFAGFSPDFIVLSSMIMTEMFFVFLTTVFLILFFLNLKNPKWYFLFLSALLLAFATLTRGNGLFLILPVIAVLSFEKRWKELLGFLIFFVLFMTPWTLRNYAVYGKFRPFNASPGLLWSGNYPGANGELNPKMPYPPGMDDETMPQDEFDDALFRAGVEQIKKHPLEFIKLTLIRASIYFSPVRPSAFWPYLEHNFFAQVFIAVSSSIYAFTVFSLGFFGFIIARKKVDIVGRRRLYYLLGFLAMLPLGVIGLVVETRYRLPVYALFAVLAGGGIFWFLQSWKENCKYFAVSALPFFLNGAFDIFRNWSRILEKLQ